MEIMGKDLSPREWRMRIYLIVLFEFIFLHFVYSNSSNSQVLNYISFAGTLVSIILAVVAIIYGFIQSNSQQTSSERIAVQVESLKDIVRAIDTSKIELSSEIDKSKEIISRLETIETNLINSKDMMSDLQNKVNDIPNLLNPKYSTPEHDDGIDIQVDMLSAKKLFYRLPPATQIVLMTIYIGKNIDLTTLFVKHYSKIVTNGTNPNSINVFKGWFSSGARTFEALGWLKIHKNTVISMDLCVEQMLQNEFEKNIPFDLENLNEDIKKLQKTFESPSGEDCEP